MTVHLVSSRQLSRAGVSPFPVIATGQPLCEGGLVSQVTSLDPGPVPGREGLSEQVGWQQLSGWRLHWAAPGGLCGAWCSQEGVSAPLGFAGRLPGGRGEASSSLSQSGGGSPGRGNPAPCL